MRRREIVDPDFGVLQYSCGAWRGNASPDMTLAIYGDKKAPDEVLRAEVTRALRTLSEMEMKARGYLEAAVAQSLHYSLAGIEVSRAHDGWIRQTFLPQDPQMADTLFRGTPTVSLVFEIEGDQNVTDVVFVNGEPVAWEYH